MNQAQRPATWQGSANQCARMIRTGHFASVSIASMDQRFMSPNEPAEPLWRGHALHVRFTGLE
jgi:hypothetical protein